MTLCTTTAYSSDEILCTHTPSPSQRISRLCSQLLYPRSSHAATLLPQGDVLIVGGAGATNRVEIFNIGTYTFREVRGMRGERATPESIVIGSDSKAYLFGGLLAQGTTRNSVEVFDPSTERFSSVSRLTKTREGHAVASFRDGTVLIYGGDTSTRDYPELYDTRRAERMTFPLSDNDGELPRISEARLYAAAVPVVDREERKEVLIFGGNTVRGGPVLALHTITISPQGESTTKEIASPFPRMLDSGTLTKLNDDSILILGGWDGHNRLATAALYTPSTRTVRKITPMLQPRAGHQATLLLDGRVLITGGGESPFTEIYNPKTESFSTFENIPVLAQHSATLLKDGRVLLVGGLAESMRGDAFILAP
jgi:hypothetical protein